MGLVEDVVGLNRHLCVELWRLFHGGQRTVAPQLIFPKYRTGKVRVSEQESRVLFCALLDRQDRYSYSVETPTEDLYRFADVDPEEDPEEARCESARSDMSLYDGGTKVANIELKALNPAPVQIVKDIDKLVTETAVGNWFHTLKNVNANTLPRLFAKFASASGAVDGWPRAPVAFTFCVLEKKWAITKTLPAQPDKETFGRILKAFFHIGYAVRAGAVEVSDMNGWEIIAPTYPEVVVGAAS